jgi:hypothetical protein
LIALSGTIWKTFTMVPVSDSIYPSKGHTPFIARINDLTGWDPFQAILYHPIEGLSKWQPNLQLDQLLSCITYLNKMISQYTGS